MGQDRKKDHVTLCASRPSEVSTPDPLMKAMRLKLRAFPRLDAGAVDTRCAFLGRTLSMPLLIGSMSGGWREGGRLNRLLATAAQAHGVALGLGSCRPALEDRAAVEDFQVRELCPDQPLLANLGVWQLRDPGLRRAFLELCALLRVDGVFIHVNPAQELVQPEGERDLRGAEEGLRAFLGESPLPVLVKQVGEGFCRPDLEALARLPVAGLDTGGAGGTSFSLVEALRSGEPGARPLGEALAASSRPTLETLLDAVPLMGDRPVLAGGGIREPRHAVVCLSFGAALVSVARPVLAAALEGSAALDAWLQGFARGLSGLMAATGCRDLAELRQERPVEVQEHVWDHYRRVL